MSVIISKVDKHIWKVTIRFHANLLENIDPADNFEA